MTRFEPVAPTGATFTLAFTRMAIRAVVRTWTALKNRRQVTLLNQLDDRCLKDIGLVRSDLDAALCIPLNRDPSLHLAQISGHLPAGGSASLRTGLQADSPSFHRLRGQNAPLTPVTCGAAKA
jgi:uncharacterized protein YjiS (DUF1127 family)